MFPTSNIQMPSAKTVISAAASIAASAMLVRSIAKEFVPRELQHYIYFKIGNFLGSFSSQLTLVIEEYNGLTQNHIFLASELYLGTLISPDSHRFRVSLPPKEKNIVIAMERNQEITDTFNGVVFKWKFVSKEIQPKYVQDRNDHFNSTLKSEARYFELSFHKKHKQSVIETYLPYIVNKSKEVEEEKKTIKLFTLKYDMMRMRGGGIRNPWQSVNLDHPATFDTLAMESEIKRTIIEDLEKFVKRREYYRRVGKAWKRGYLLFGPPGTGKSSLIAAMANYLNFDIYDLELTDLRTNSDLRMLVIGTANKSILVVEDIDCSIEMRNRLTQPRAMDSHRLSQTPQVTLSGLLNFIDGLWSSCGDERIIVFTTNHKDRIDPALLRPGRMDVHIHMSYCTPCGFKLLASNYLGITQHPLFSEVEQSIETTKATPAEVGEQLMKDEDPETALKGLIEFLHAKKVEDEIKASEALSQASEAAEPTQESKEQKVDNPETVGREVGRYQLK